MRTRVLSPSGGYDYVTRFLPCGTCFACRQNQVNAWVSRFLAECRTSEYQLFITLTYDDSHLKSQVGDLMPLYSNRQFESKMRNLRYIAARDLSNIPSCYEPGTPPTPSVCKRDVQLFFKNIRHDIYKASRMGKVRYFATAEYGGRRGRPHYHLLLFCSSVPKSQCKDIISRNWPHGHVHIGSVGPASIRYVANFHVNKSATPDGAYPSFTLQSRRPGIGGEFSDLYGQLYAPRGFHVHDGIKYPYVRYFNSRLGISHADYDFQRSYNSAYPSPTHALRARSFGQIKLRSLLLKHTKLQ